MRIAELSGLDCLYQGDMRVEEQVASPQIACAAGAEAEAVHAAANPAGVRYPNPVRAPAGGAERACKEAKKASVEIECQWVTSAKGRDAQRRMVLGLRVRPGGKRQPTEVAVGRGRVHPRVLGLKGGPRHHEQGCDRHARRTVRDACCAPVHSQRQWARVYRPDSTALAQAGGRCHALHRAGSPWESGYAESFHGRFRDEFLASEIFGGIRSARALTAAWKDEYNTQRPHSSLGYRTPAGFVAACAASASAPAAHAIWGEPTCS